VDTKQKVGEVNSIALLQHGGRYLDEVAKLKDGISAGDPNADLSIEAAFVHMVMMSNNGDPSDPAHREAVVKDGIGRFLRGQLVVEKRGDIYEMFLIK
jgi:hypothetical protein